MELIPVTIRSSKNQPSQTYKSNLTQTWHAMFPFRFLKGSYLERIHSEHYIDEEVQFLIDVSTKNEYERNIGIDNNKLFKQTAKPTR